MQTLYTLSTTETSDVEKRKRIGSNILNEKLTRSLDLLTISILYTLRTAQYAENDSIQRSSKYLPTQEDLNVNTKIAGNEFLWQILGNQTFVEKVKESKSEHFVDEEWIKKIYQQLAKSNEYQEYISVQSRDAKSEKAIIQFIWEKLILENEALQEHFSEEMPGWEDDREMTLMLMENFFKSGSKTNFLVPVSGEKKEYAYDLMNTVQDKEEYIMQLIQPRLINWDAERIALIDLILLRMGVAELLYFPTIPTKVTINEYIEVGKMYSTLQSGQFINGVLDNILKDLEKEKLIQKQERVRK